MITENQIRTALRKLHEAEHSTERYMFFSNLQQIKRQAELLLEQDEHMIEQILSNGHDWADDHITVAKENMDQVFDFFMNEIEGDGEQDIDDHSFHDDMVMMEGRKKAGTKLCARGLAAAKGKFKIFPSAYSNGYGVQVCKGTKPGLDGKKRCSPPYC